MLFDKRLRGRQVAALVADGFEQIELSIPVKALRAEGAVVSVISLARGKILGMSLHEPGRRVRVDRTVAETEAAHYDALLLPGGFISPDLLRQSSEARALVRSFDEQDKPIATLCHGPWVLASADLVRGRQLTSWPGIRDDLVNAGAIWRDEEVVRDRNLISSRSPQDLPAFVRAMIDLFAEPAPAYTERPAPVAPSPQRSDPPFLALATASISPRWRAVRKVATLAALAGLAFLALRRVSITV